MKVDPARLRQWRDERAGSQDQLAAVSGLSLRTVQRVESTGTASADTRMALATAFGVDVRDLRSAAESPVVAEAPAAPPLAQPPTAPPLTQPTAAPPLAQPPAAPPLAQPPAASTVDGPPAAESPSAAGRLSHRSDRLLRLAVVVGLLVAIDVAESGRVGGSRWALAFGLAFVALRLFRHRFVDEDGYRLRGARIIRGRSRLE